LVWVEETNGLGVWDAGPRVLNTKEQEGWVNLERKRKIRVHSIVCTKKLRYVFVAEDKEVYYKLWKIKALPTTQLCD